MEAIVNDCRDHGQSRRVSPNVRQVSLCVDRGRRTPRPRGLAKASSLLRAGLFAVRFGCRGADPAGHRTGFQRARPGFAPGQGPDSPAQRRSATSARRARRITRNSPPGSLQVEKGTYGETSSPPQNAPARARQGCGNETVAVHRHAVRAACTPRVPRIGSPTGAAAARTTPWPGRPGRVPDC